MDMDLLAMLMDLGQVQASAPGAGQEAEAAAGEAASTAGTAVSEGPSQPMQVMRFGEIQVMGRDLSAVSFSEASGRLTIGGTADVTVQGTGRTGEQTILVTGSGTVTIQDLQTPSLAVESAEARIVTVGRNILGQMQLGKGVTLTLDGRGLLQTGAIRGGGSAVLRSWRRTA